MTGLTVNGYTLGHRLIRETLKKFKETFSTLSGKERAECIQLILKDVVVFDWFFLLSGQLCGRNVVEKPGQGSTLSRRISSWKTPF